MEHLWVRLKRLIELRKTLVCEVLIEGVQPQLDNRQQVTSSENSFNQSRLIAAKVCGKSLVRQSGNSSAIRSKSLQCTLNDE